MCVIITSNLGNSDENIMLVLKCNEEIHSFS